MLRKWGLLLTVVLCFGTSACAGLGAGLIALGGGTSSNSRIVTESKINGDFECWTGETIFVLQNEQIWQQSELDLQIHFCLKLSPRVTIIQESNGRYLMVVEGVNKSVQVIRIY